MKAGEKEIKEQGQGKGQGGKHREKGKGGERLIELLG